MQAAFGRVNLTNFRVKEKQSSDRLKVFLKDVKKEKDDLLKETSDKLKKAI